MTATQPIRAVIEEALAAGPTFDAALELHRFLNDDAISYDVPYPAKGFLKTAVKKLIADHDARVKALEDELGRVREALQMIYDDTAVPLVLAIWSKIDALSEPFKLRHSERAAIATKAQS